MLDLDAIFNPEGMPIAPQIRPVPADGVDIRVEDLDSDRRIEWEERAAILEYDGGQTREQRSPGTERSHRTDVAGWNTIEPAMLALI